MTIQYLCDYCRGTIDTSSDASLIVAVHRQVDEDEWSDSDYVSGDTRRFRYCSQAHLATHMERVPLPAADPSHDDDDDTSVLTAIGCAIIALALIACTIYGAVAFARLVV